MPQRRQFSSNAERQRAYRQRKARRAALTTPDQVEADAARERVAKQERIRHQRTLRPRNVEVEWTL